MAVRLMFDSGSDVPCSRAKEKGWVYLPMTVTFGSEQFRDGIDIDTKTFFDRLIESDELPSTSQISPADFEEAIEKAHSEGDVPLIITISSKLSGTYQSAVIAAESAGGEVYVVDSLNATLGEAILIEEAGRLIDSGVPAAKIKEHLDAIKHRIRLLAVLGTLEYLKKGGRISSAVAMAGSLLQIKPVVSVEDGEIKLVGKARGSKNGNNLLAQLVMGSSGIDFEKPYSLAYSGTDRSLLDKYVDDSRYLWEGHTENLPVISLGATIGTHVGPGAIAVAFFEKNKKD